MKRVSRAGAKLSHAIDTFSLDLKGLVCADFGCSHGGFTQEMLSRGAFKVYAVDTAYGIIDYSLRTDERVIVMERKNAMHVVLPEKSQFITVDVSWTPQKKVLPNVFKNLTENGSIVSLVKPHYEAEKRMLTKGLLEEKFVDQVLAQVRDSIKNCGGMVIAETPSPITGKSGKNQEYLFFVKREE